MEAYHLHQTPMNDTCIICEEKKESGVYICNQLICSSCQEKIVETEVDDATYPILVKQLKKLSLSLNEKVIEGSS